MANDSSTGQRAPAPRDAGRPSLTPSQVTPASRPQRPSSTAEAPAVRTFFDPWNSSSTGHQRAENCLSGSTSWRVSRNLKLGEQYREGLDGGGKRVADTVGAGSEDFGKDGRKANGGWEKGAKGLRTGGQQSLAGVWGASKVGKKPSHEKAAELAKSSREDATTPAPMDDEAGPDQDFDPALSDTVSQSQSQSVEKQIFANLCFYTNGSTAPLVSDHKLKHMLAAHGARHSITLGRRSVTHVIVSTTNAQGGAGGGLASTKIQKEVARTGGKAVRFVSVNWVLESIKAGRRLPESRFCPLKLAPKTQHSVLGMMTTTGKSITRIQQDQG